MQVSVTDEVIEVTIRGKLDFNTARELLLCCKAHSAIHPAARAKINLEKLANASSCSIAAIALISDWMLGGLQIKLSQCSREVHQSLDFGIGNQRLSNSAPLCCTFICNSCFDNNDYLPSAQDFGDNCVHSPSSAEC
ncbi:MAG: hypothetical protein PHC94_14305 [Methylobacter sp.]|nr:hypothetical protein [Methylococcales bacterium]MDD5115185.1 hypothetical protein [Methylobacter sp.]